MAVNIGICISGKRRGDKMKKYSFGRSNVIFHKLKDFFLDLEGSKIDPFRYIILSFGWITFRLSVPIFIQRRLQLKFNKNYEEYPTMRGYGSPGRWKNE